MMSASAANDAPAGVETASYNLVVDIVMWVVIAAIGASALPGLISIMKVSQTMMFVNATTVLFR